MTRGLIGKHLFRCVCWLAVLLTLGLFYVGLENVLAAPPGQSPEEGKRIFQQRCASCHTVGGGVLVGPDLKGVTTRRDPEWLKRWIKEPDRMLAEGDPIAMQLLKEFNNVPMPNLGLKDEQVEAIIAYLKAAETSAGAPRALPAFYVPTLAVSLVAVAALTALGLLWGRKRVEVRP